MSARTPGTEFVFRGVAVVALYMYQFTFPYSLDNVMKQITSNLIFGDKDLSNFQLIIDNRKNVNINGSIYDLILGTAKKYIQISTDANDKDKKRYNLGKE